MSTIKIESELDAQGFETGLQRLRGGAEKFGEELSKKFSAGKIFGSILHGVGLGSGFGAAETIVSKIADQFERAAAAAKEMAGFSARAADEMEKHLATHNSPEQQLKFGRERQRREQNAVDDQQKKIAKMPDSILGVPNAKKEEEKVVLDEMIAHLQILADANDDLQRQIDKRVVSLDIEHSRLEDNLAVTKGTMTERQAAERELARLNAAVVMADVDRLGPNEVAAAKNAVLRQQNVLAESVFQEFKENRFTGDRGASISASSLAKIGGGGNVNITGPMNPLLQESKSHTSLLRQIVSNTNKPAEEKHSLPPRARWDIQH